MAMTASSGVAQGAGSVPAGQAERSPFIRTTELLAPYQPAKPLITLSLGEPQHPVPDFVGPVLAKHIADFGRYPLAKGIEPFRRAAANWLTTRFDLPRPVDPESEILVLNGSREGLFFAAITAARYVGPRRGRPAILVPNPFYPAYGAGARAAGCETIYLPTTLANGFLPDLDTLDDATLARTVAFFIASPANPQGAVAAYSDEVHVEENRRLYRIKFDLADQILGNRYGYVRPAGGFCVWLDVSERGGDEAAAVKLYRDAGVRVIPGSYLSRQQDDGSNPGAGYIRLALVSDSESTAEALHRLVEILD